MRTRITSAGLMVLGFGLIGWAALALAQQPPPIVPEPVRWADPLVPARLPPGPPSVVTSPSGPGTVIPTPPPVERQSGPTELEPLAPRPMTGDPLAPKPMTTETPAPRPAPTSVPTVDGLSGSEEQPQASVSPGNPSGRQEPAVSLEWIGPPTAKVSQPTDYSLMVRNVCNIPVQQVLIRVRMPQPITVVSTEPKCVNENNVLVWDIGTLMAKQEKNLQIKLQANSKGDMMPQAWVTFTGSSILKFSVREPKLTLKASVNEKVMLGDTANFSLTVSNPGDGSADRVKIHAVLSEGLEHASKGKDVEFEIGNLAAGETRSVQLLCNAKVGGIQTCDAVADSEGGLTVKDSVKLTVSTPRLDLALSGPSFRYLGRKALYTLKVSNPGDATATNVKVGDVVPDGFKVLAASDGGRHDFATRTVSWYLGEIAPGQTREVKFEVEAINVGDHKHKSIASAGRGLQAESELTTRVEGLSALMLEMIDTEDPIEVGGETAYEVRLTNTGSKTETDIRLVATVPDKMELKDCKGPVRYRTEGKNIVFEPIEKLAPRADLILRITVKAMEAGVVRFKIQMTSANMPEPIIKMESTRIYSDAPESKSSGPAPSQPMTPPGFSLPDK